jgi:hypothetical protein
MDLITENSPNFHTTILQLLAPNHPQISIHKIFTFLWCLWKMRNEKLFNNIEGSPHQVIIRTNALLDSMQLHKPHVLPTKTLATPRELLYNGPKMFVDAAWKEQVNGQPTKAGAGIYIT